MFPNPLPDRLSWLTAIGTVDSRDCSKEVMASCVWNFIVLPCCILLSTVYTYIDLPCQLFGCCWASSPNMVMSRKLPMTTKRYSPTHSPHPPTQRKGLGAFGANFWLYKLSHHVIRIICSIFSDHMMLRRSMLQLREAAWNKIIAKGVLVNGEENTMYKWVPLCQLATLVAISINTD